MGGAVDGSVLTLYGTGFFTNQCHYPGEHYASPPAIFSLQFDMKLGRMLYQKAYCPPEMGTGGGYYNQTNGYSNEGGFNTKVFQSSDGGSFIVRSYLFPESTALDTTNRLFSVSVFDKLFNHLQSNYIVTGNMMRDAAEQEITIDKQGKSHIQILDFESQSLYYAVSNEQNQWMLQKKMSFKSPRKYGWATLTNHLIPSAALTEFTFFSYSSNSFRMDQLKLLTADTTASCFGTDTSFLVYEPAEVSPINWPGNFAVSDDETVSISVSFYTVDYLFSRSRGCLLTHKCDTLKLHTPDTVCSLGEGVRISVYKSPYCDGTVGFYFDTAAVTNWMQLDDTTLYLRFADSWRGKILATLSSCSSIRDSVELVVLGHSPTLELGKDTLLCDGNTLLLKAPAGMRTYSWQDGSGQQFFTASEPGTYFVTATDFCNRVYSDTIHLINPAEFVSAGADTTICINERVRLKAPSGYLSYSWSPNYAIDNTTDASPIVYPGRTTLYVVRVALFPGCVVKDTVTVKVEDCSGEIFIPSAFTPDGDGRNDMFLPIIRGELTAYELVIYNRWGQAVFRTRNPHSPWDGRVKGMRQPPSSFVWICRYQFRQQPQRLMKGTVTLVR